MCWLCWINCWQVQPQLLQDPFIPLVHLTACLVLENFWHPQLLYTLAAIELHLVPCSGLKQGKLLPQHKLFSRPVHNPSQVRLS